MLFKQHKDEFSIHSNSNRASCAFKNKRNISDGFKNETIKPIPPNLQKTLCAFNSKQNAIKLQKIAKDAVYMSFTDTLDDDGFYRILLVSATRETVRIFDAEGFEWNYQKVIDAYKTRLNSFEFVEPLEAIIDTAYSSGKRFNALQRVLSTEIEATLHMAAGNDPAYRVQIHLLGYFLQLFGLSPQEKELEDAKATHEDIYNLLRCYFV